MELAGQIVSLQMGQPQTRMSSLMDGNGAEWTSAIFKSPVAGRVALGKMGLAGDGQADMKNHGGVDKAVCCYAAVHYPGWQEALTLSADEFTPGAFGENFTITGLTEDTLCIGDIFSVGTARVQISQPRMPCWKMGRRWNTPHLPQTMIDTGRTGWYLRVLQTGDAGAGDALTLLERPLPQWTVAQINHALYVDKTNAPLAYELGRLPLLAEAWRSPFRRRAGLLAYRERQMRGE